MTRIFEIALVDGDGHAVDVARRGDTAIITIDGRDHRGSLRPAGDGFELTLDDRAEPLWLYVERDVVWVHAFGCAWQTTVVDPVERERAGSTGGDTAAAPMPGTVIRVDVEPGDEVHAGQLLLVIESMKMQTEIIAERDGVVDRVFVLVGDTFDRGAKLVALQALPEGEET